MPVQPQLAVATLLHSRNTCFHSLAESIYEVDFIPSAPRIHHRTGQVVEDFTLVERDTNLPFRTLFLGRLHCELTTSEGRDWILGIESEDHSILRSVFNDQLATLWEIVRHDAIRRPRGEGPTPLAETKHWCSGSSVFDGQQDSLDRGIKIRISDDTKVLRYAERLEVLSPTDRLSPSRTMVGTMGTADVEHGALVLVSGIMARGDVTDIGVDTAWVSEREYILFATHIELL